MSISPETLLFIEVRAICLMGEAGRDVHWDPSPVLIAKIAERLAPYADDIANYGKPPAMAKAWETIANETGSRTGQINLDMLDIATIHHDAINHGATSNKTLIERIQRARSMLRSQAFPPRLRILGEAAALAVAQPDFHKGHAVYSYWQNHPRVTYEFLRLESRGIRYNLN